MNELIRQMIDCMTEETSHYRKLALLADQQKELLVGGKVEALPENLRLVEKEVFALNPITSKRNDLWARLAKNFQIKNLSLEEAFNRCPLEQVEEFKKAALEWVQSAKRTEEINKGNEKLLGNALSFANFTLQVIRNGGKIKKPSTPLLKEENKPSFVNRVI